MKSLITLIRLQKQKVDELRRALVIMENQRQQYLNRVDELARELQRELELASTAPEMSAFFGDFADRIRRRREDILLQVRKVEKEIEAQRVLITDAFGELKKYEVVRDRRIQEAKEKQARKDGEMLDEIALQQDTRKRNKKDG